MPSAEPDTYIGLKSEQFEPEYSANEPFDGLAMFCLLGKRQEEIRQKSNYRGH